MEGGLKLGSKTEKKILCSWRIFVLLVLYLVAVAKITFTSKVLNLDKSWILNLHPFKRRRNKKRYIKKPNNLDKV